MTLIIAGYGNEADILEAPIYFATDSHITYGDRVLVKGFKKVINIPIILKDINFLGEEFRDYRGEKHRTSCVIAFAGSSLVAQHMINSITNHLSNLLPTYLDGNYTVAMDCEHNKHLKVNNDYAEDMFTEKDFDGLLNAKLISDVVLHSLDAVLNEARKIGSMASVFNAFSAEFILGLQCPSTKDYFLYKYEIIQDDDKAKAIRKFIAKGDLAVIGQKKFYDDAIQVLNNKSKSKDSIKIFEFLNKTIDDQNSIGIFGIGKPSGLFYFDGGILKKEKVER